MRALEGEHLLRERLAGGVAPSDQSALGGEEVLGVLPEERGGCHLFLGDAFGFVLHLGLCRDLRLLGVRREDVPPVLVVCVRFLELVFESVSSHAASAI